MRGGFDAETRRRGVLTRSEERESQNPRTPRERRAPRTVRGGFDAETRRRGVLTRSEERERQKPRTLRERRAASTFLRLVSVGVLALTAGAQQAPTPESVLGHKPGDDFYLATYEDSLGYFRKLA